MIIKKSKRIGINWRIQMLENEIRILDFKNQLVYLGVFNDKNTDINVYRYLTTVKRIKEFIEKTNIVKREMR